MNLKIDIIIADHYKKGDDKRFAGDADISWMVFERASYFALIFKMKTMILSNFFSKLNCASVEYENDSVCKICKGDIYSSNWI